MPFYKRENDELLVAPNFVYGPGYELQAENHATYTYPVEGWYWYADLDAAMTALVTRNTQAVSMRQARLALLSTGRLADVNSAIAGLPEPQRSAADIEWNYGNEVQRNSTLVTMLGGMLGLTDTQLDELFALAATL